MGYFTELRKQGNRKSCKRKKCPYYTTTTEKCSRCEWNSEATWTTAERK